MLWRWRIFNCPWMALSVNFPLNSHSPWTSWCYVWRLLQLWFFAGARRHTLIDSLGGKLCFDWVKWRFCMNSLILPRTSRFSLSGFFVSLPTSKIADLHDVVICTFRFLCLAGIVFLLLYNRIDKYNVSCVASKIGNRWYTVLLCSTNRYSLLVRFHFKTVAFWTHDAWTYFPTENVIGHIC